MARKKTSEEARLSKRAERERRRIEQGRAPRKSVEERRAARAERKSSRSTSGGSERKARRARESTGRTSSTTPIPAEKPVRNIDWSTRGGMRIKFSADLSGIVKQMNEQRETMAMRIRNALEKTARSAVLEPMRKATASAFNSKKLPTTWRLKIYPDPVRNTLNPSALIWSNAAYIIEPHASGVIIGPGSGKRYLAIPSPDVPRKTGGKPLSYAEAVSEYGPFRFARGRNNSIVVIASLRKIDKEKSNSRERKRNRKYARESTNRDGSKKSNYKGTQFSGAAEEVVFFVLVKQVRLRQRLDVEAIANTAGEKWEAALRAAVLSR